jgi:putative ABC transport system substrate-binding protein
MSAVSRRQFVAGAGVVGLGLVASCASNPSQPVPRGEQLSQIRRIGLLSSTLQSSAPELQVFRQALGELGYVDGEQVAIEYQLGREARASTLVGLPVDVIVAVGNPAISSARDATRQTRIPIVMINGPTRQGLEGSTGSRRDPHRFDHITGLTAADPEGARHRLQLLKQAFPSVSRVAAIWSTQGPRPDVEWQAMQRAAQELNIDFRALEMGISEDVKGTFENRSRDGTDALVIFPLVGHLS